MSDPMLDRRAVVRQLLADRTDQLVVSGLGNPTWDVVAAGDSPLNFYLWGGMGGATMLGLGLALAQPERRVVVITGDGEMLMGLGSLATIGCEQPPNLAVVVLDNARYGETGMQPSHTARGVDLGGVAAAAGFREVLRVRAPSELDRLSRRLLAPGLLFASVTVGTAPSPPALPARDGTLLRARFRDALLGSDEHG